MTAIPQGLRPYRSTDVFNGQTVPAKFTACHRTKPGVWGRIEVVSGTLKLTRCDTSGQPETVEDIAAGNHAIVAPEEMHFVTLADDTEFRVTFLSRHIPLRKGTGMT